MLLDLLDKLIDRCIQLLIVKKQHDHDLFNEFVQPVFSQFEVVHNFYLSTFNNYKNMLDDSVDDSTIDVGKLYYTIRNDNVFSEHIRQKLRSLTETSGSEITRDFIVQIHDYLLVRDAHAQCGLPFVQKWEALFILSLGITKDIQDGLLDISSEYPKMEINILRNIIEDHWSPDYLVQNLIEYVKMRQEKESHIRTYGDFLEEINAGIIACKRQSLEALEQTVCEMQKSYTDVIAEYIKLKKKLA